MPILFWDASGLAKRYAPETGSSTVDALFAVSPRPQFVATALGYAETCSTLLRKHHGGILPASVFTKAKTLLRDEVVNSADLVLLTVDDAAIFDGIPFMEQYSLNATDGAILAVCLRYAQAQPPGSPAVVVVAADHRLLGAAKSEGRWRFMSQP